MPSLISILSSQSSSRFAHALSKEIRVSTGAENASVKGPANLGISSGPAAPSAFHIPAPPPSQQHVSSFQQQLQHQLYQLPLVPVAQQSIPRGIYSSGISAIPADRCGLHLIRGDALHLQLQDPSTTAVSRADVAGDVSISSSIRLADLISDYFEGCDEDSDALDGLSTLRAGRSAQAQYNLGSLGEEANQRLSADYLDRQMQVTDHDQLRTVQSLAAMDGPVESGLYDDVIAVMTDARACHANDLRGTSSLNAAVAERLRAMGYDAAVCTTQWDTSPTMPEGECHTRSTSPAPASPSPTFTRTTPPNTAPRFSLPPCAASSVSADGASPSPASAIPASPSPAPPSPASATPQRFIVDLDFRAQFQIARPTREYACALESAPLIFVGRQERLARLVEVVSGAMRGALRAQGMHIPPWRKGEYLLAKWMAAVSQRIVCQAKEREEGMVNEMRKGMEGEGEESKGAGRKGEYLHAKWMAAVSQRVVCEAKGTEKWMEGEGEESEGVVGKGNVGEGMASKGMEGKGMENGGVVQGDKDTATAGGGLHGGEDFHAPTISAVTFATSTADPAVAGKPAPAVSPVAAGALPAAAITALTESFYASPASGITDAVTHAPHRCHHHHHHHQHHQQHQQQQQQSQFPHATDAMGDAVHFQGRLVPSRRFAALHQCAQAGGR
ncbi:unnamed protein product [Closterium sp. Yama58-4]|nr:unnamed protein product [Closterium sp. Yama58-4]